jgi:SAM-dependent methyltransferase
MATPQAASHVTPQRIMQYLFGYGPSFCLEAAIQNRVFDVLDERAKTIEEVSQETGASIRGLRAIMNLLVGLEFLAKDSEGRYSLTPESATFLVSTKPAFHGGVFRHNTSHMIPQWLELNEVVRTGRPAKAVNREAEGAEFFQQFVEDLFPLSYAAAQRLAEVLQVSEVKEEVRVLDLAAGSGVWGLALAESSPKLRVTVVDWSKVVPVTKRMVKRFGLEDRYEFIEGDLLKTDFGSSYDIATLGHLLHCIGEERSRALLKKTFDALAPGGTIAIQEFLVNDSRTTLNMGLVFAVNMLVNTDQGDTFSFEEIKGWLQEAGFKQARMVESPGPSPLILATKADA